MFTGLIEQVGELRFKRLQSSLLTLEIRAQGLEEMKKGDSVACNGVCLTLTERKKDMLTFDVMEETLRRTLFKEMPVGASVNLERALPANGRFDGHIVQGHVDGIGVIRSFSREGQSLMMRVAFPPAKAFLMVEKGSVAVDGVSLTVAAVGPDFFSAGLIPHTLEHTALKEKKPGDKVHLEYDIIGKYVKKMLEGGSFVTKNSSLEEALREW